jgi:hypothetical protein
MNDHRGVVDAVANGHGAFVNNAVVLPSFRLPGPWHWISIVYYIRCSGSWLHKCYQRGLKTRFRRRRQNVHGI